MARTSSRDQEPTPLVVYVVNHAAFFVSHRLPIALAARNLGLRVTLITGQAGSESMEPAAERKLAAHGIEHVRLAFTSAGLNPLVEIRGLCQLAACLRSLRPNLVHCISPKGILYGGIAARLMRVHSVVFAVSGMGFAFTPAAEGGRIRAIIAAIYRLFAQFAYGHKRKRVIVQNKDDAQAILASGLAREIELEMIAGSGVDIARFAPRDATPKQKMVLFPARILRDKGALEFIEAARRVRAQRPDWRFVMAGSTDYRNPSKISDNELQRAVATGTVEWLGHIEDMSELFQLASIVCLPSYREGLPKALLEAAAAGCAVVTTDTPGCREAILPNITGIMVPPRSVAPIASALLSLIDDPDTLKRYGLAGRKLAAERFTIESVVDRTLRIYEVLLKDE